MNRIINRTEKTFQLPLGFPLRKFSNILKNFGNLSANKLNGNKIKPAETTANQNDINKINGISNIIQL